MGGTPVGGVGGSKRPGRSESPFDLFGFPSGKDPFVSVCPVSLISISVRGRPRLVSVGPVPHSRFRVQREADLNFELLLTLSGVRRRPSPLCLFSSLSRGDWNENIGAPLFGDGGGEVGGRSDRLRSLLGVSALGLHWNRVSVGSGSPSLPRPRGTRVVPTCDRVSTRMCADGCMCVLWVVVCVSKCGSEGV